GQCAGGRRVHLEVATATRAGPHHVNASRRRDATRIHEAVILDDREPAALPIDGPTCRASKPITSVHALLPLDGRGPRPDPHWFGRGPIGHRPRPEEVFRTVALRSSVDAAACKECPRGRGEVVLACP